MSVHLKSCPFCGGERIKAHYIRDGQSLGCQDCGAGVRAYNPNAGDKCVELWNRRYAIEHPSARITGDKDRENPVEGAPTNRWLAIEVKRLRNVLRYITELAYVDHQSGNQNYEYLQGIADSALRINAHTDHPHD